MYGVLYAVSPEIFPAKDRGTGSGLVAISTRAFGVLVCLCFSRFTLKLTRFKQGSDNCPVCQYTNFGPGLYIWRIDYFCGFSCVIAAFRAKRARISLNSVKSLLISKRNS